MRWCSRLRLNFQLAPNRNARNISLKMELCAVCWAILKVELIVTGSVLLRGKLRPSLSALRTEQLSRLRDCASGAEPLFPRASTRKSGGRLVAGIASDQQESAREISSRKAVTRGSARHELRSSVPAQIPVRSELAENVSSALPPSGESIVCFAGRRTGGITIRIPRTTSLAAGQT